MLFLVSSWNSVHITLIRSLQLYKRHWSKTAVLCTTATVLRYCATFKVNKFESLFYKINTHLQKATTCIGLQAEQNIFFKYEIRIYFQLWRGFWGSFFMLFPVFLAASSVGAGNIWIYFIPIYFLLLSTRFINIISFFVTVAIQWCFC